MKNSLLSLCLYIACSSTVFAQQLPQSETKVTTQRWSDVNRFVEGQEMAQSQTQSPALNVPGNQRLTTSQTPVAQSEQGASSEETHSVSQDTSQDRPPVEDLSVQRLMWSTDPVQNVRQEGRRLEGPLPQGFALSKNNADRLRLAEWKRHLLNLGVPQSKIDFEARRLNREEFETWASKLVWWDGQEHPNVIDVGS